MLKAEKGEFKKIKHEFLVKANMLDTSDYFVGQGARAVPVGDQLKQRVLQREGFSSDKTRGAYQAWNFIDGALQSEADRSILKRCKSPSEAFDHLEKWYDPESEVATQNLYNKFHDFTVSPKGNPIKALHALKRTNNQMAEKGRGISDTSLHARFVRALPGEYDPVKAALQAMKNRDRAEIIRMIGTRYSTLPQKKGSQWSSRRPSKRFFRAKAAAGKVRNEVVVAVAGAPRAEGTAGKATKVEITAAEEAVAAPVVPAVVVTAAVEDLMAAIGDATGGATSGRSAPRRRVTSSPNVLGARVLATKRAYAHQTQRCWRLSCRCQKRISPWKPRHS